MDVFADLVVAWQKQYGRHDLAWQGTCDPYRIWVSEIMLQQTQVTTVAPYFQRFMQRFPTVEALAAAPLDEVIAHWAGLGYYSRARNLHRAARQVMTQHGGRFPQEPAGLAALPGIGRSTANAVAAFAFGARAAILDGNVKRLLARCFGVEGFPGERRVEQALWRRAESLLPQTEVGTYTQGLMDLGATVCTRTRPRCHACPVAGSCVARAAGRIAELPAPKPRRAVPHRHTGMLVLLHDDAVLLERRPPAGIWGGLLCLPEFEAEGDPGAAAARLGLALEGTEPLAPLAHSFTHFRLTIRPVLCRLAAVPRVLGEPGLAWVALADAAQAGVPAPVRRLLAGLARDAAPG